MAEPRQTEQQGPLYDRGKGSQGKTQLPGSNKGPPPKVQFQCKSSGNNLNLPPQPMPQMLMMDCNTLKPHHEVKMPMGPAKNKKSLNRLQTIPPINSRYW